jgi:hypothetical protein
VNDESGWAISMQCAFIHRAISNNRFGNLQVINFPVSSSVTNGEEKFKMMIVDDKNILMEKN